MILPPGAPPPNLPLRFAQGEEEFCKRDEAQLTGIWPKPGFLSIDATLEDQQPGNLKSWMRVCQPPLGRYMPTNQNVQSSTGSTVIW